MSVCLPQLPACVCFPVEGACELCEIPLLLLRWQGHQFSTSHTFAVLLLCATVVIVVLRVLIRKGGIVSCECCEMPLLLLCARVVILFRLVCNVPLLSSSFFSTL